VWRPSTEGEIQVYGWAYEDFRAKYDELWPQGWRLHLLNNYVVNGEVLYTAVWRPSTEGEIQVYGWAYEDFRAKYDELWPQGWRLHIVAIYTTYDALTDYMRDCLTHNVPIPPDWPKGPTGNWVNLGVLDVNFLASSATPIAELWAFRDNSPESPGTCFALPRKDREGPDGMIQLLGIICQSDRTKSACFWDNMDLGGTRIKGPERTLTLEIAKIQGGDQLRENCTMCHRGDNAFLIHPEAEPFKTRIRDEYIVNPLPNTRYYAIASFEREFMLPEGDADTSAWRNLGPDIPKGSAGCGECHEIPRNTGPYRTFVFMPATSGPTKTMPPTGPKDEVVLP
jgi:hypothetical protein